MAPLLAIFNLVALLVVMVILVARLVVMVLLGDQLMVLVRMVIINTISVRVTHTRSMSHHRALRRR